MSLLSYLRLHRRKHLPEEYVRGRLAGLLNESGEGADIQRLENATNAYVARVRYSGGTDVAVRWWPWVKSKRKGREHAFLSKVLSHHGLPVPKFLVHDDSAVTRGRYGGEATAETFLDASDFRPPWTDQEIERFAALVAKLHAIASPVSGKPWRPDNEQADLSSYYGDRWEKCLAVTRPAFESGPSDAETDSLLERGLGLVGGRRSFALLHMDLSPCNLFRVGDDELALCDFGAMAYGCFEQELAILQASLFRDAPETMERFLEGYFNATEGGESRREAWDRGCAFFLAFHHLEKSYSNVKRAAKAQRKGRRGERAVRSAETARRHWDAFTHILEHV